VPAGESDHESTNPVRTTETPLDELVPAPLEGSFENADRLPPLPGSTPVAAPAPVPAQEWKKIARAEVNPKWFWRVVAGAAALAILVIGFFALRARSAATPTVAPDAALEQEVRDRKQTLEEGQKLFTAGQYSESLAKFRQVLARSPNNEEARKYAQMAENAVKSQQDEAQRREQAAAGVAAARTALTEGRPEEAKQKAEEILAADASNADAQAVRDEADSKIAEKVAAEAAARKKAAKPKEAPAAAKKGAVPTPAGGPARAAAAPPPPQGPAPPAVPGTATVRLVFDSPIPEGHVMIAVNDQILLRKPFSFKKGENRSVLASLTVQPGSATIKAWLSGPDMASAFATTTAQVSGGETKTLRLDYSGGKLGIQLQ